MRKSEKREKKKEREKKIEKRNEKRNFSRRIISIRPTEQSDSLLRFRLRNDWGRIKKKYKDRESF